jgi:uncharacterized protein (TIGR00369 family)
MAQIPDRHPQGILGCHRRKEKRRQSMAALKWQADEVMDFLHREFPQAFASGKDYRITGLEPRKAQVTFTARESELRPGGTVSGPALMEFVDFAVYFLLLAHHRDSARLCVTTNLQISFLSKAGSGTLVCDVELIKHGRTLSVADARISAPESGRMIAHAQATYYMANNA